MAKIWFAYEADKTPYSNLVIERPLRWCVKELGLTRQDWKCILGNGSILMGQNIDLDFCNKEPFAVIIEVENFDLLGFSAWQTGYYIPSLRPQGVKQKLSNGRCKNADLDFDTRTKEIGLLVPT